MSEQRIGIENVSGFYTEHYLIAQGSPSDASLLL